MLSREDYKYLPLAAVGLAKGVAEVYVAPAIKEARPSTKAWVGLLGAALIYDALAPDGETLTERFADFSKEHPVVALGSLAITVGHLTDTIRDEYDPYHIVADWIRR